MPAPERLVATRVAAAPAALDTARWPAGARVFRIAPDEALVEGVVSPAAVDDPHAIVEAETGFVSHWIDRVRALDVLQRACEWEIPSACPAFAQGAVAGLPVKVWFEADRVLFIVPAPFAGDFAERVR